jgi:hypothetical protein
MDSEDTFSRSSIASSRAIGKTGNTAANSIPTRQDPFNSQDDTNNYTSLLLFRTIILLDNIAFLVDIISRYHLSHLLVLVVSAQMVLGFAHVLDYQVIDFLQDVLAQLGEVQREGVAVSNQTHVAGVSAIDNLENLGHLL